MMKKQIVLIALMSVVGSLTSGCAATWKERAPDWSPKEPVPALLAHYKFQGPQQDLGILDAVNAVQGKNPMASIGEQTMPALKAAFAEMNIALFVDKERAHKVDESQQLIKIDASDNVKAVGNSIVNLADASAGDWIHPATSRQPFHLPGLVLKDKFFKGIVDAVKGENPDELTVSIGVGVSKESSWGVMHGCSLMMRVRALDGNGKPVFQALTRGASSKSFFGDYITEATVREALMQALAALDTAEWDTI